MINIDYIDNKQYIRNILEGGDRHTIELFLRLFEVLIHNFRIDNDGSLDNGTPYMQGAINEFLKIYNIMKPKPEKKKEE